MAIGNANGPLGAVAITLRKQNTPLRPTQPGEGSCDTPLADTNSADKSHGFQKRIILSAGLESKNRYQQY